MRKKVYLGDLQRGRVFYVSGQKYKVVKNLGEAGVSVKSQAQKVVKIGGRSFKTDAGNPQVWSAGSEVEVNAKQETTDEEATDRGERSEADYAAAQEAM